MSKPVKQLVTDEYRKRYEGVDSACVVNVVGLDAISANRFRGEMKVKNIRVRVVKNALARRAFADGPLAPLANALDGPCALVTGGDSIIDVAKTLAAARKTYPKLELKLGILEGDPGLVEVDRMAQMKGRIELLGDLAGLISGPGRRLAGCLRGPGGRLAGCIEAVAKKQEESGE